MGSRRNPGQATPPARPQAPPSVNVRFNARGLSSSHELHVQQRAFLAVMISPDTRLDLIFQIFLLYISDKTTMMFVLIFDVWNNQLGKRHAFI